MNIEKNVKIATLMSSIAEVPGDRFSYAGYDDKQIFAALIELVPADLLARYAVDLERVHGRAATFVEKLSSNVISMPGSPNYVAEFRQAYAALSDMREKATHAEFAPSAPFGEDLPSITSVMSHIEAERNG